MLSASTSTSPTSESPVARIVVIGSINIDLVARCQTLPIAGQTLSATGFAEIFGGKGANQAVAASRAGGNVQMIGRVGDDAFAGPLRANLRTESIDDSHVMATGSTPSGLAMIAVDDHGENQIVVVPGANGQITVDDVRQAAEVIQKADVVLVQLEIPLTAVSEAVAIARQGSARIILDPAPVPATPIPADLFQVDLICPNETEASAITGMPAESIDEVTRVAQTLHQRGAHQVAITLGSRGTLLHDGSRTSLIDSFPITPVDTTGAGDAFAGALAVRWAQHHDLADAVRFANAAGALAATRDGAQPGMPTGTEIHSLIES